MPATQKTGSQESEVSSQNEQPGENIQGEQPGARMGTGYSEDIENELKNEWAFINVNYLINSQFMVSILKTLKRRSLKQRY